MVNQQRLCGVVCTLVLGAILVACFWPFHSPKNRVGWLGPAAGLRFDRYGTAISRGPILVQRDNPTSDAWTLQLWLRPRETYQSGILLAFYDPQQPRGLALRQWNQYLVVQNRRWKRGHDGESPTLVDEGVFHGGRLVFLTVTSSAHGTRLYIDGDLVRTAPQWPASRNDLSGQLVLANSPVDSDSWSGELLGLALYNRELSEKQIVQDYMTWPEQGSPENRQSAGLVALYLFNQGSGSVIHSRVPSGADLVIPERFREVHQAFLKRPWDEYYPGWGYWKNVVLNVIGFVPLGFCFYGYSLVARVRRGALATVLSAAILSATIETLQAFLPTRDSGLTDVISNTSGAAVGIGLLWCATVACEKLSESHNRQVRRMAAWLACRQQGDVERVKPSEPALTRS